MVGHEGPSFAQAVQPKARTCSKALYGLKEGFGQVGDYFFCFRRAAGGLFLLPACSLGFKEIFFKQPLEDWT